MRSDLPKAYEPAGVEDAIYAKWEASGVFNPDKLPERNQRGEPYCIMMPPPNRTGILHLGHATMLAIQDLLIRFHRMCGERTLWVPGTDHASIATESKVEALLREQGMGDPRRELGREKFLEKVRDFADESGRMINAQVRKMGSSCDWSRERYTFDEDRGRAVSEVFRMMWEDGIIERGDRIVNWDPRLQTTVSDDEIEYQEERAPFYTFQYGPFRISTARPETKFGDKYVVMHPDDERYTAFKDGDTFTCEWINGPIQATIIKDVAVDPSFGTGVMTITPWHDLVDFELAERHGLDKEQIIDERGRLLPIAGEFVGLSIEEARPKIVEKLKTKGLLVEVDQAYVHNVAISYRGGGMIEPQIKRQWFVRVNKSFVLRQDTLGKWKKGERATLKELMHAAVATGQVTIIPERFTKIYFHWVDNLRDWCISRQIWFGYQIPIWYKGEEARFGVTSPGQDWVQDPDTLDTWFSSGTWTFSALGWPGKEWERLRAFHPTDVLETGYDIIFFWVARMVLMSTYVLGEVPFKDTYLHGLVRDERGQKMSKSLGNVLNPLDLIPKYGTDAVRLSLVMGTTPGQDVRLSEEKIEGFRNFTNKLWNIARFILTQADSTDRSADGQTLADEWILDRLETVTQSVTRKLKTYQFSSAGEDLRDFTWSDLADWYLEIAKVEQGKEKMLQKILRTLLILWHPFLPFVTEHIWQTAGFGGALIVELWPAPSPLDARGGAEGGGVSSFERLRELVTDMRRLRAEQKVPAGKTVEYVLVVDAEIQKLVEGNRAWIERLAQASVLRMENVLPTDWPATTSGATSIALNIAGAVDQEKERIKVKKELQELETYIVSLDGKLSQSEFVNKAPSSVIESMRKKLEDARAKKDALDKRL